MYIFIDESGTFVIPPDGKPNFSCVGALIVAERRYDLLATELMELQKTWSPSILEIKGRKLGEEQIFQIILLCLKYDCKFIPCCTDMAAYTYSDLNSYRDRQAFGLVSSLTERHHSSVVTESFQQKEAFEKMSCQLYVQWRLQSQLLDRVLREISLFYALRDPPELSAFRWVIDAKDKEKKTAYEICWEATVGGLIQSQLLYNSMVALEGADYSYFFKNFTCKDQKWPDHLPSQNKELKKDGVIIDISKIFGKDMKFSDSEREIGLQLVDVLTNAFRRAVMGRLRYSGWCRLGELMIRLTGDAVGMFILNSEGHHVCRPLDYASYYRLKKLERKAKIAFAP